VRELDAVDFRLVELERRLVAEVRTESAERVVQIRGDQEHPFLIGVLAYMSLPVAVFSPSSR